MPRWRFLYRIADYDFAVEGDDPRLRNLAGSLYRAAHRDEGSPRTRFILERRGPRFILLQDGEKVCAASCLPAFFQEVEWALTEAAMAALGHFFQIHAGVVVHRGRACLLVGRPDAGKTSLVLGLAARGGAIFTDEVALVEPRSLQVNPFPRDLIVHRGTQQLFSERIETTAPPPWKIFADYRYLSPADLAFQESDQPATSGRLVFPVLRPGIGVSHRPLGQAEAARRLLEQSFDLAGWGAEGMDLVGRLVEACPASEVVFGDARSAAEGIAAGD